MSRRLSESFDEHVVGKIEAAAPPAGGTGTDLISKLRTGIAAMADLGGTPSVLALTPSDAAALDLSQDGEGHFIFTTRIAGSGSPIWSLLVRESPSVTNPLLIDPATLGLCYFGGGEVLADPYGANLKTNQVSVRVEAEAAYHVRNVLQGAYAIS